MAAISRAFDPPPPPRLFRTKPPPAFDEDDERGLPPDADDDDTAAHAVIAEHTAHRTNCADGGCTNTVPHPRCCGVPVHVILGMIKVCSISFFNCGFGRKRSSLGRISSLKKRFSRTTQQRQQLPRKRAKEKGKTSREKNMPAAASAARVTRSSAANKTRGAGEKRNQSRPPIINPEDEDEDKGDDDVDSEDSDSDDAPPEEVTRAVAEKETREEQLLKKRARETQQLAKEREKEKRVEKAKARTEAAAKRKREKEEKRKAEEEEEGKENEREEEEEEEGEEEDPDAFTLDDDIVDAVAASENQLKEKYLKDFHDTKSQRKKRKKQMKRERMREEAMGRESAKFTTRDGFDVVIRSKVDELAEMKANPKAVDFARRRLDAKHRRDERMLCDTRTGKIKNQFAVR